MSSGESTTTTTDAASAEPACVRKRAAGKITKIVKIGVMGDGTVGKTSFLLSYITHGFVGDYTPTVFDNFSAIEEVDQDVVNVILWDLAGQDEYSAVRNTCCQDCKYDILLVCFSTVLRDSYDNIKHKWLPEIRRFNTELPPIILVGTKTDLRDPENEDHITTKQGERLAKELKMQAYLECSAKNPDSVATSSLMPSASSSLRTRSTARPPTRPQRRSSRLNRRNSRLNRRRLPIRQRLQSKKESGRSLHSHSRAHNKQPPGMMFENTKKGGEKKER